MSFSILTGLWLAISLGWGAASLCDYLRDRQLRKRLEEEERHIRLLETVIGDVLNARSES